MTTYVDFTVKTGPGTSGDVVIQLSDDPTVQTTVNNFLGYALNTTVGQGYTDSFFHRLASNFVLQGGGYDVTASDGVGTIAAGSPIADQYSPGRPNLAYTVAMAQVGGDPNSATDQFFINLADNSSNLDVQNGGFTVFGQVLPSSQAFVQQLAALPVVDASGGNANSPFSQLPVEGTIANNMIDPATNLVEVIKVAVSTSPPCFCAGTLILTTEGEVPVELIEVGDRVVTASGQVRPVVWVGRRRYAGRFAASNPDLLPVCLRAGCLGDGLPRRDLFVSPRHAMLLDRVLIPAALLVNGASVTQAERVDEVSYHHVELESQDAILAEGAAAETFVDDSSRMLFQNAAEFAALYPDAAPKPAMYYAPRIEAGPLLDAVRQAIDHRAGLAAAA